MSLAAGTRGGAWNRPMTRVVLHIGGEATGTTSLQASLAANSRALFARTGLLYPVSAPFIDNRAHFPLAAAFVDRTRSNFIRMDQLRPAAVLRQALASLVARERPGVVAFSAEHFSSRYGPAEIAKLAEFLSPHPVTIVFYVRAQDELALSAYSGGLMAGERGWFHYNAVRGEDRYFNHCLVADDWAAVFGAENLRVRPYSQFAADGLVRDFLVQAGISDPPPLPAIPRLRQSMSIFEARLIHALNQELPTWQEALTAGDEGRYRRAEAVRNTLLRIFRESGRAPESRSIHELIGPAERGEIIQRFESGNRALAEKYGVQIARAQETGYAAGERLVAYFPSRILIALIAEILGQMKANEEASRAPRRGLRALVGRLLR
jgi:hypothetical protein